MTNTIEVETFTKDELPKWAQANPAIFQRAVADNSYRVNVFNAENKAMRSVLSKDATRWVANRQARLDAAKY